MLNVAYQHFMRVFPLVNMEQESSSNSETVPLLHDDTETRSNRPSSNRIDTHFWPKISDIFNYLKAALKQVLSALFLYQGANQPSHHISHSLSLEISDPSITMKVLNPFFFILAASSVVHSIPTEEKPPLSGEIVVSDPSSCKELAQSMNEEHHTLIALEKRATCERVNRVIRSIGHTQHK
ncbi:hypothetical protein BDV39DRAFT_167420 [Aspergillus sergii]|uniref:Uncharacterized protein n=1 Tax=Aspergillus sergii TaxID=1034303 RepID=A0A5N6XFZ5_9EURO|nr:hypothetical protein BDV39DRAFT_167420 [Aspergillus sergii]